MRQFHSHHNLLSLAQPSLSRHHSQDHDGQDRRGALSSALSFTLGGGGGSCSSLSGSTESSIWVRQTPQEESKPSPASNFWDFFTGKGSSSETMVWWRTRRGGMWREIWKLDTYFENLSMMLLRIFLLGRWNFPLFWHPWNAARRRKYKNVLSFFFLKTFLLENVEDANFELTKRD